MNAVVVLLMTLLLTGCPERGEAWVPPVSPQVTQNLRGETVLIPHSVPETSQFLLGTYFKITLDDQLLAIIARYDDPKTRLKVDYVEIFQGNGDLLGLAWFDEFGVLRTAVDYGLIEEASSGPSGVLVLLEEGIRA